MPRRRQVRVACQRCRKKRAKCDGGHQCERCQVAGLVCVFDRSRRESKDDLREEIERLRRANAQSDALLDAISSMEDPAAYFMVAQGLQDRTATREGIFLELYNKTKSSGTPSSARRHSQTASSADVSTSEGLAMTCAYLDNPLSMQTSTPGSSDWGHSADAPSDENVVKPIYIPGMLGPPPSLASSGAAAAAAAVEHSELVSLGQRVDGWTRTGWTAAVVLERLDSLLVWDYLPFCLLCKDSFLRDLVKGTGQYCSSALVNALLALATPTKGEQHHQQRRDSVLAASIGMLHTLQLSATTQSWTDSQAFFNEAQTLIGDNAPPSSLPNIQALGIMALYHVCCGRESEARKLAGAFAAAATDLCLRAPVVADQEYARVRATTYCGAISLVRIMKLTTAQPSGLHATMMQDDGVTLDPDDNERPLGSNALRWDRQPGSISKVEASRHTSLPTSQNADATDAHRRQLGSLQIIPAKIFQLTEWVYKLLASPEHASGDQVAYRYRQCLDWYENFFALLRSDGSKSPFILFIHIYYHFCLLSLFRPFYSVDLEPFNLYPREICLQAAQSILKLTQSYAGLYGLSHVSPLVPYFVYAAGLLSVAVEQAGHGMLEAVPVATFDNNGARQVVSPLAVSSPGAAVETEPDGDNMDVDKNPCVVSSQCEQLQQQQEHQYQGSGLPAHVNMPAIAHARLLLEEMGKVHPAATAIEGKLHRASSATY